MKKTSILIAMFALTISAASAAKAVEPNIDFDGKFKPQSMHDIFTASHQLIPVPTPVPAETKLNLYGSACAMVCVGQRLTDDCKCEPYASLAAGGQDYLDIPVVPQAVAVPNNLEDKCFKMSVGHANTIPLCIAGGLSEEDATATAVAVQYGWERQALLRPDIALELETIAKSKNCIVKYEGNRLFLKKVSTSNKWVDGNPATSWHPNVTPIPVAVPTHTVGEATVGGLGGFTSGPAAAIAGALAGAVHGFIQDVHNYADHGNTNDED